MTYPQIQMIDRVKQLCREDEGVVAAMMYGSFALGLDDPYSDIEFVIFFKDKVLENLDPRQWLEQVAPVALNFVNEYGIMTVIFENLVRGEFHLDKVSDLPTIAGAWQGTVWFPTLDSTLIVDKCGTLTPYLEPLIGEPLAHGQTAAEIQGVAERFVNWYIFGHNVLQRGEYARALELLWMVQRHLLMLARILEGQTTHWHIPSRTLEQDVAPQTYARYVQCTASLEAQALKRAYRHAWAWGEEMLRALKKSHELTIPTDLLQNLSQNVEGI